MRALVLALVASMAWAQSTPAPRFRRFTTRTEQGRNTRGLLADSYAFFEFAPASGAGMPAACGATAPTGAKGEALTFTRTGSATCTKTASGGLATTGIANGDLVTVAGNVARVEYDSQGVLGLLVESARTNSTLDSANLAAASWSTQAGGGAALPSSITANAAVAPDGTTTATRVVFAATSGATQLSLIRQVGGCPAGTVSPSVYVRGNGSSGTIAMTDPAGGAQCALCSFTSTGWTRCSNPNRTGTNIYVGNDSADCAGNPSFASADVFLWGAQCEAGAYVTSYIPTTTAAVTRNAEQADIAIPSLTVSAPFSLAATVSLPGGVPTNARLHGTLGPTGLATFVADSYASGLTWTAESTQVSPISYSTGRTVAANGTYRASTYHDGTNFNGCIDGTCGAGVARAWTNLSSVVLYRVGAYTSSNGVIDGIQSRVCFQNDSATRCR